MKKKEFLSPPRRVGLFVTCMVDMMYPDVGMATVELLEKHGVEVFFPLEQTCCGQPAFNAGFRDEARSLAERFINVFEPLLREGKIDAVVAPSGSCTTMTSHFYPTLFEGRGSLAMRQRAETLAASTFELTEFLVDVMGVVHTNSQFPGKVTYHACCHLLRELRVDEQPRTLLSNVRDIELIDHAESDACCGFGGLFAVKNAGISTAMGERKVNNLVQSGTDLVAMCDVSCLTHINGLLEKRGERCRAIHIAEVLNEENRSTGDLLGATAARSAPSFPSQSGTEKKVTPEKPRRWQGK